MLAGIVKFHLSSPDTQSIGDNIFVDNVMLGATLVEQAYKIYVERKFFKKP